MSFDVHFLDPAPGESFQDALDRREESATEDAELTPADLARWESVLTALLPGAEESADATHRDWHSGPAARELVAALPHLTSSSPPAAADQERSRRRFSRRNR